MNGMDRLVRSENFVERQLGDETVLVPINQLGVDVQSIYTLNLTAAAVWKKLETQCSVDELIKELEFEFSAGEGIIEHEVFSLLEEFVANSFVSVVGE